ncbi:hypothetical protein D3C81_1845710 [compost metagenome]
MIEEAERLDDHIHCRCRMVRCVIAQARRSGVGVSHVEDTGVRLPVLVRRGADGGAEQVLQQQVVVATQQTCNVDGFAQEELWTMSQRLGQHAAGRQQQFFTVQSVHGSFLPE